MVPRLQHLARRRALDASMPPPAARKASAQPPRISIDSRRYVNRKGWFWPATESRFLCFAARGCHRGHSFAALPRRV